MPSRQHATPGNLCEQAESWIALSPCMGPFTGFVYAVGGGGLVKIGTSIDPVRRLVDIQNMSPVPLSLVGMAHGGQDLERELHARYADRRQHGEWFSIDENPLPGGRVCFGCAKGGA